MNIPCNTKGLIYKKINDSKVSYLLCLGKCQRIEFNSIYPIKFSYIEKDTAILLSSFGPFKKAVNSIKRLESIKDLIEISTLLRFSQLVIREDHKLNIAAYLYQSIDKLPIRVSGPFKNGVCLGELDENRNNISYSQKVLSDLKHYINITFGINTNLGISKNTGTLNNYLIKDAYLINTITTDS